MTTTAHVFIGLELDQTDDCLSGRITRGDGAVVEFSGWLGLVAVLDALVRPADENAAGRTTPRLTGGSPPSAAALDPGSASRANHPVPPAA